jgi:hypothetical protein
MHVPAVDTTIRHLPHVRELLLLHIEAHTDLMPEAAVALAGHVRAMLARPIPGETMNAGKIVRHVIDGPPAEPGYLKSWWVAAEDPDTGEWVTWQACALEGELSGRIGYNGGDYFNHPDPAVNKRRALRSLSRRAGVPVATVNMDADEAFSQLLSRSGPHLEYKKALALMKRADTQPGKEVGSGTARLTRREHTSAARYDLREVPKRGAAR